jgi:predicted acyltransferase
MVDTNLLPQGRLRSLDVLRGATIAGMILVNNPGDWGKTFAPFLHAEWHGWTPTDLIFPFFLFVLGVAIPLAFASRLEKSGGDLRPLYLQILRRTIILFGLGLFLAWFPFYDVNWAMARIPGVLQRIAVVYLFASLAYLNLGVKGRAWLSAVILLGYWLVMKLIPVPGIEIGSLGPDGNPAAWLDHAVLGAHVWRNAPGPGDPEGILSSFPAVVTALAGVFTGEWLRSQRDRTEKLIGLFVWGTVISAAGYFFGYLFPINKNLWTSSYVVLTAGLALLSLAVIYYFVDIQGKDRWAGPFYVFGTNAITVFVLSGLVAKLMYKIRWTGADGATVTVKGWLYGHFFASWLPDYWVSLAWAVATIVFWWAAMRVLYQRRIFIKI